MSNKSLHAAETRPCATRIRKLWNSSSGAPRSLLLAGLALSMTAAAFNLFGLASLVAVSAAAGSASMMYRRTVQNDASAQRQQAASTPPAVLQLFQTLFQETQVSSPSNTHLQAIIRDAQQCYVSAMDAVDQSFFKAELSYSRYASELTISAQVLLRFLQLLVEFEEAEPTSTAAENVRIQIAEQILRMRNVEQSLRTLLDQHETIDVKDFERSKIALKELVELSGVYTSVKSTKSAKINKHFERS